MEEFKPISAKITVFCHATEDEDKVMKTMNLLLPRETEVARSKAEGYHKNPIIIFTAETAGKKAAVEWWEVLLKKLDEKSQANVIQKLGMIDKSNLLFLRFDKQKASKGDLVLAEGGDVIHVMVKFARK